MAWRKPDITHFTQIQNLADPYGLYALLQLYIEWMQIKNYSNYTTYLRESYLLYFLSWASARNLIRPTEITKPILERYQRYLFHYRKANGDPLSVQDQYNRGVALRHWFKWLTRQNYILHNPASELELPKLEKRLPKAILTVSEAESVLAQPDVTTDIGLRDRAILEVFYSTGIRRLELIQLTLADLDSERGVLTVRLGKGSKDRMIPIGKRAVHWAQTYLQNTRTQWTTNADAGTFFITQTAQPISLGQMSALVRRHINAAKIKKTGSCHLFRHTMATLMLENGADIRYIQAMLGHVNLSTTEIYTQVSIKKLKEVHTLTHPAKFRERQSDVEAEEGGESEQEKEAPIPATAEALMDTLNEEMGEEMG